MRNYGIKVIALSFISALVGDIYAESYRSDSYSTQNRGVDSEEDLDNSMFPYRRASSSINAEDVVAIMVCDGKTILMSKENTFYVDSARGDKEAEFKDFDSFSKYPNLLSIDLHQIVLTQEKLNNLKKYIPDTVKNLIVYKCKIEQKDYEDLSDIIAHDDKLISLTVVQPDAKLAEATKVITAASELKSIKYLNFTLGELGSQSCDSLITIFDNCAKSLTDLVLGFKSIVPSESYDKMLTKLQDLENVKKLEFSVLESTEDQVSTFFTSVKNMKKIEDIKFFFDDFSKHDDVKAYHNAQIFAEALPEFTHLKNLDISGMKLPDSVLQLVFQSVSKLQSLAKLNVSGNVINKKTAGSLSEAIKEGNSLTTLVAKRCEMNAESFSELCRSLGGTPLRYVYLSDNDIGSAISNFPLAQMNNIMLTDFSNNNVTYEDAMKFVQLTENNSSIRVINFGRNAPMIALSGSERNKYNNEFVTWQLKHPASTGQTVYYGM